MKTIEIIFTVGAPGSGKSTWAEKEALKPGTVVVTMDDLRSMIVIQSIAKTYSCRYVLWLQDINVLSFLDKRSKSQPSNGA